MAEKNHNRIMARERALVDAQILIQEMLNRKMGNPRDFEESDPKKTSRLFKKQRKTLAGLMDCSEKKVNELFSDNSEMGIKDLSEVLSALGYELVFSAKRTKENEDKVYKALEDEILKYQNAGVAASHFGYSEPYFSQIRSKKRPIPKALAEKLGY